MCERNLRVAMCGRNLRCAGANPLWLKLAMCVRAVYFQACDVRSQVASCDVRSQVAMCACEPILFKTCDVHACDVFLGLRSAGGHGLNIQADQAPCFQGVILNNIQYSQYCHKSSIIKEQNLFLACFTCCLGVYNKIVQFIKKQLNLLGRKWSPEPVINSWIHKKEKGKERKIIYHMYISHYLVVRVTKKVVKKLDILTCNPALHHNYLEKNSFLSCASTIWAAT